MLFNVSKPSRRRQNSEKTCVCLALMVLNVILVAWIVTRQHAITADTSYLLASSTKEASRRRSLNDAQQPQLHDQAPSVPAKLPQHVPREQTSLFLSTQGRAAASGSHGGTKSDDGRAPLASPHALLTSHEAARKTSIHLDVSSGGIGETGDSRSSEAQYDETSGNTVQAAVATALGIASIAFFMVSQMPQLILNYQLQSCDGLSPGLLGQWLLGDIANLTGCLLAHQLSTQIWAAIYFCVMDIAICVQWLYYSAPFGRKQWRIGGDAYLNGRMSVTGEDDDPEHDFGDRNDGDGDRACDEERRRSAARVVAGYGDECVRERMPLLKDGAPTSSAATAVGMGSVVDSHGLLVSVPAQLCSFRRYDGNDDAVQSRSRLFSGALLIFAPMLLTLFWVPSSLHAAGHRRSGNLRALSSNSGPMYASNASPRGRVLLSTPVFDSSDTIRLVAQSTDSGLPLGVVVSGAVLSWLSGLCYFGSRIPQIIHIWRRKSTTGVSLTMFLTTICANVCYGAAILVKDPAYDLHFFRDTLPYVIGSIGVLGLDVIIVALFLLYRRRSLGFYEAIQVL